MVVTVCFCDSLVVFCRGGGCGGGGGGGGCVCVCVRFCGGVIVILWLRF